MKNNAPYPFESNGQEDRTHRNPAAAPPSKEAATVLEDALNRGRFPDGDAAVVCPGCGETVERFYEGLPDPLVRFNPECDNCGVPLRRWAAVVLPAASAEHPPMQSLKRNVQQYWERQFRIGVAADTLPHTREFTETTQNLASTWDWDWEVECQLCDRSVSELSRPHLGYHHWVYSSDIGTSLCRGCHDYLHGDDNNNEAITQDWTARELGLRDFRDLAVIRLVARDRAVHNVQYADDDPRYAERLQRRYNLPLDRNRIIRLSGDIRHDEDIRQRLEDVEVVPSATDSDPDSIPIRRL